MWLKKITSARMDRLVFRGALVCLRYLAWSSSNPFVRGSAEFFVRQLEEAVPLFPLKKKKPSSKSSGNGYSI